MLPSCVFLGIGPGDLGLAIPGLSIEDLGRGLSMGPGACGLEIGAWGLEPRAWGLWLGAWGLGPCALGPYA